jgi:hypothetical protein
MALKKFSTGEMLNATDPWVRAGNPERVLLDSVVTTAPMMRLVELAHAGLIAAQRDQETARSASLRDDLGQTDDRHDMLARVIEAILSGHRMYHRGTPLGALLDALYLLLFPDGLQVVTAGYRDSAGRAQLRDALLTEEQRALLASVPVQGATLRDWVTEWNQLGERMGTLSNERATPLASEAERPVSLEARNHWIRVVRTVLGVIELEVATRPELQRILDRIATIDAEVDRRSRAGGGAPTDGDDGLDDSPDDDLVTAPPPGNDVTPAPGNDVIPPPATPANTVPA